MDKSEWMTRRSFIVATGAVTAGAMLVSCADAETPNLPAFTPEAFGAKGDGTTDDTAAFQRLAVAVNANGGGEIVLRSVTYLVGRQEGARGGYAFAPASLLALKDCRLPVVIRGNGGRLRCAPHLRFGTFDRRGERYDHAMPFTSPGFSATPYEHMILVQGCRGPVQITDLELDGNIQQLLIGGPWGDTGWQIPAIGLFLSGNIGSVLVRNVFTHHHAQDGLMISAPSGSAPSRIENVRSAFNARQGCSFIGGSDFTFVGCRFTDTGRAKIGSAPAAGVDLEAESGEIRRLRFISCEFARNEGVGMVADSGDTADVTFDRCRFVGDRNWAAWPNKPRFRFTRCQFVGPIVRCFDAADPAVGTTFTDCRFTDLVRRGADGKALAPGPIADLSSTRNTLFRQCTFTVSHGFALPWSLHAIYDSCSMHESGGPIGYPRGTYRGASTIIGKVDLYGSKISGVVTINGQKRTA
jgi:hypothetical protein